MEARQTAAAQIHRDRLVAEIVREAADTASWTGRARFTPAVLGAVRRVPRHVFIPGHVPLNVAYANRPQPIGQGQTISQPYIVALMTDLLNLRGHERVLEVGTGCGYQCAVLAELASRVYSIERLAGLAASASATLTELGYANVEITVGNGAEGWSAYAPYDAILVTASQDGPIPKPLIEQLARGGRMVIPLGTQLGPQMLHLGTKDADGGFAHLPILPVAFVPLVSHPENG